MFQLPFIIICNFYVIEVFKVFPGDVLLKYCLGMVGGMRGHLLPSLVQVGSRWDVSGQPGGVELVLLTCPRVLSGVEVSGRSSFSRPVFHKMQPDVLCEASVFVGFLEATVIIGNFW